MRECKLEKKRNAGDERGKKEHGRWVGYGLQGVQVVRE